MKIDKNKRNIILLIIGLLLIITSLVMTIIIGRLYRNDKITKELFEMYYIMVCILSLFGFVIEFIMFFIEFITDESIIKTESELTTKTSEMLDLLNSNKDISEEKYISEKNLINMINTIRDNMDNPKYKEILKWIVDC